MQILYYTNTTLIHCTYCTWFPGWERVNLGCHIYYGVWQNCFSHLWCAFVKQLPSNETFPHVWKRSRQPVFLAVAFLKFNDILNPPKVNLSRAVSTLGAFSQQEWSARIQTGRLPNSTKFLERENFTK